MRAWILLGVSAALIAGGCAGSGANGDGLPPGDELGLEDSAAPGGEVDAGAVFKAHGNEPFWSLVMAADSMILTLDLGDRVVRAEKPEPVMEDGAARYATEAAGTTLTVVAAPGPCVDSMSGMPHPKSVTVEFEGRTLRGCGGEPADLLAGVEWVVVELFGAPALAEPRATLHFDDEGGVGGFGSCNTYGGEYALTGEALRIGALMSTKRACGDPTMGQEFRLFEALGAADRFGIRADGALALYAGDKVVLVAEPAA